jgi:alpha-mannosidase
LTGGVAALVDKKSGRNFVPPGQPMGVVVSEVKKAEAGDDLVIRLYETEGTKCTARVKGNGFTVEMTAYGIATVRVKMGAAPGRHHQPPD